MRSRRAARGHSPAPRSSNTWSQIGHGRSRRDRALRRERARAPEGAESERQCDHGERHAGTRQLLAPRTPGLRSDMGDPGVTALSGASALAHLKVLNLSGNAITASGTRALASSSLLEHLVSDRTWAIPA